jgi:hypothetical protein
MLALPRLCFLRDPVFFKEKQVFMPESINGMLSGFGIIPCHDKLSLAYVHQALKNIKFKTKITELGSDCLIRKI